MIVPDPEPCDIQHLTGMMTVLLVCAFGTMGAVTITALLKSWEYLLSIREYRLRALHRLGGK